MKEKILIFVQTPRELVWACKEAGHFLNAELHIVRLGDASSRWGSKEHSVPPSVRFLYLPDLEIDNEEVWRNFDRFKEELRAVGRKQPTDQLHLVAQDDIASGFLFLLFAQTMIRAAFDLVSPNQVLIPPMTIWRVPSLLSVENLQASVYEEAGRRKIECRSDFWSASYFLLQPIAMRFMQAGLMRSLKIFDIRRSLKYRLCRSTDASEFKSSILLLNANLDLDRQFSLRRFSATTQRRSVIWNQAKNEFQFLTNPPAGESAKNLTGSKLRLGAFSASATELVKPYFGRSFWEGLNEKTNLSASSVAFNWEKMWNLRRIAYAARLFVAAGDVLSALQPAMVVVSDTIDTNRAVSLSARALGIPVLATAHGLNLVHEPITALDALGDLHTVFSQSLGQIVGDDMAGLESVRMVAYDNLSSIPSKNESPEGKYRIFFVTSPFTSANATNWTNEVFVEWSKHVNSLKDIMQKLAEYENEIEVVIKSHPRYDCHNLYDDLKKSFPRLVTRHWSEPIGTYEPIPADLVVLYNCISTFAFTAIKQHLPVIGFWNALTPLARRKLAIGQLSGTDGSTRLVRMILEIVRSPHGSESNKARQTAQEMLCRFVEPTSVGLSEAVERTLNLKKGR